MVMKYYIFEYNDNPPSYGDYVEAERTLEGGLPVASDPSVCICFDSTEEAHQFAKENDIEIGSYRIEGFWGKEMGESA